MYGRASSGTEIRRILLLTRLRESPRGLTINQLVRDCKKVEGWNIGGTTMWEGVRQILQSLINDRLVAVATKFEITSQGKEYLEDPLQWQLSSETSEEVERKLFWNSIYDVFDKALARLLSRSPDKKSSSKGEEDKSQSPSILPNVETRRRSNS